MSGLEAGGSLYLRARKLLASYRGDNELTASEWLRHAHEAHAYALTTFPEERRERALPGFVERNCVGQAPRTIAVFTLALRLFGEKRSHGAHGFGDCLEAAAHACGASPEELPPPQHTPPTPPAPKAPSDTSRPPAPPPHESKPKGRSPQPANKRSERTNARTTPHPTPARRPPGAPAV